MKPHHIIVSFTGSQTGLDSESFEAGTVRALSESLAEQAVKAGYAKPVDEGKLSGPRPKLSEEPDAENVLIETKVTGPEETKVEAPAETKKPAKFGGKKKG